MKADFHFHFYSRIVIMAVLALLLVSWQKSVDTVAQEASGFSIEVGGWAWSELTGWISLNCHNDFNGDGMTTSRCADAGGINYGVEVYRDGNDKYLKGCAWSGNPIQGSGSCSETSGSCVSDDECPGVTNVCEFITLGWICFSDPIASSTAIFAPDDGIPILAASSTVNAICSEELDGAPLCNAVDSYGTIISLEDAAGPMVFEGWKFGFPIENEVSGTGDDPDYPVPVNNPLEGCFNCHEDFVYGCSIGDAAYTCDVGGANCICDPIGDDWCQDFISCTEAGDPLHGCTLTWSAASCTCPEGSTTCVDLVNCPDVGEPQTCDAITLDYKCENCLEYFYYDGICSNDASSCSNDDDCGGPADTCDPISTCSDDIEQTCTADGECGGPSDTCIERGTGSLKKVLGGYSCSGCNIQDINNTCGVNQYKANINSCDSCTDIYRTPGLMLDNKYNRIQSIAGQGCDPSQTDPKEADFCQRGALCGWAWNSWAAGVYGLGWFQFEPRVVTTSRPFLFVEGGNIYSKGNVLGKYNPPFGKYNSSYLIESGGRISNFVSESTLEGDYQGELSYRPDIDFLNLIGTKYQNVLGAIDYIGLITDVSASTNKYGSDIVEIADLVGNYAAFAAQFDNALDNKVVVAQSGFIINSALEVQNGDDVTGISGAGTVVVEGNLEILENITYDAAVGSYTNLKEIPSIVWIIKGDLYVSSDVTELAGTFIVLGDGASPDDPPCSAEIPDNGCGLFLSNFGPDADVPLLVNGSVIARRFDLGRLYNTGNVPAERFLNDGRLQANPPKGMTNFSRVVPRFE